MIVTLAYRAPVNRQETALAQWAEGKDHLVVDIFSGSGYVSESEARHYGHHLVEIRYGKNMTKVVCSKWDGSKWVKA